MRLRLFLLVMDWSKYCQSINCNTLVRPLRWCWDSKKGIESIKFPSLKGLKRHTKATFPMLFLLLGTYQLSKNSAPQPHLEGTLWHNSYHCCKKQRWLSSFLQPLKETIAALLGKKYAPTREHKAKQKGRSISNTNTLLPNMSYKVSILTP